MTLVRAAGGVVWRSPGEVLLVHRPRYDDWSLPKGKLSAGERPVFAAVREVHEETGVRAALQYPVSTVHYISKGLPKSVDFWAMRVVSADPFTPGSEVDATRWVPLSAASDVLSYSHDTSVVSSFRPVAGVVVLVRHASAGERGAWPGPDTARPLDPSGTRAARSLATVLALFGPSRLVSASPRRCVSTLSPLSSLVDLPVEVSTVFDEGSSPAAVADRLRALAAESVSTVVCSQRDVIPPAVGLLRGGGSFKTAKGGGWILPFTPDGTLLNAYPLPL